MSSRNQGWRRANQLQPAGRRSPTVSWSARGTLRDSRRVRTTLTPSVIRTRKRTPTQLSQQEEAVAEEEAEEAEEAEEEAEEAEEAEVAEER
jgi:hypothetical protein